MHALLRIGPGVVMVSDTMPGQPLPRGANIHVCLDFDDVDDLRRRFEALAAGGTITMPLQDTFWGATFGILVDAYGVGWMLNCTKKT
jgi:PhnB protein